MIGRMTRLQKAPIWVAVLVWMVLSVGATTPGDTVSLDGGWLFRLDRDDVGARKGWFEPAADRSGWRTVAVPHTWQVEVGNEDYRGVAWYAREVHSPTGWKGSDLRIEFDAVYRDCTVWLNGTEVGSHLGSGWTAFSFSLRQGWNFDAPNEVVVRVDNRFSPAALPYEDSFDWAGDGGIIRSARVRALPVTRLERLQVSSRLSPGFDRATVEIDLRVHQEPGVSAAVVEGLVYDPLGRLVGSIKSGPGVRRDNGGHPDGVEVRLKLDVDRPTLWHFDAPALYRAVCLLVRDGAVLDRREAEFGIRKVEVKNGFYYLNGEPMRLMGVEWMPGSDPRYGMAEPSEVTRQILRDMKALNVILTRFHWQQDDFVFQFGDREGLLIQEEIPAWGSRTMDGQLAGVQAMQMEEMVRAHFNHPSIYAWGLCNEIGGQSEKAHQFVRRGMELGRRLDSTRLLTWASNSLQSHPGEDASGLVDFIEWNDYWESWYRGDLNDLEQNLVQIREAFPDKSLVISEYGLCECDPRNPSGDPRRIEILRTHTDRYRKAPNVAGAIFFDYNDYRTHIGDKGKGSFQQRVHGVVDLLGRRKPSYEALRRECSPVKRIRVGPPRNANGMTRSVVEISTRDLKTDLPAYTLRGYTLVWQANNDFRQPIASGKVLLPDLVPGTVHREAVSWESFDELREVRVEIFRPTGYSVMEGVSRVGE